VQTRFIFNVRLRVAEQLFTTYLNQPWTFHLQRNSSQLIRNILSETQQLTTSALTPLMRIVTELLLLAGLLSILLIAEPLGALSVGLVLGLASLTFYGLIRKPVNRWGKVRQHHERYVIQHLQQGLNGVKDVKLLGREAEFVRHYRDHNQAATKMIRNQNLLSQMPRLWLEFLAVVGLAVLVASMIYRGSSLESVLPTLALFAAVAFRMMPSANKLVSSLQQLRFSTPAVDAIYEELQLTTQVSESNRADAAGAAGDQAFKRKLSFDNVSFCYPDTDAPAVPEKALWWICSWAFSTRFRAGSAWTTSMFIPTCETGNARSAMCRRLFISQTTPCAATSRSGFPRRKSMMLP
jgi:ABC-type multidrug transport system fused ATPase/permease subunit